MAGLSTGKCTMAKDNDAAVDKKEIDGEVVYSHTHSRQGKGGATHLPNGKFAPGNGLGGRLKRDDERAIVSAMNRALPPEKIQQSIEDALMWAYEYKSPKLIMSILQFVVSYRIGTPVQRSISASGKLENLLSQIADMEDSDFDKLEGRLREE